MNLPLPSHPTITDRKLKSSLLVAPTLGTALLAMPAWAQETTTALADPGHTAFVFACALAVLLMTIPGLALFYAGLVRAKNVLSVLMQVFATTSVISILWVLYGYSLAFTDGGSLQAFIGGLDKVFLRRVNTESLVGEIPELLYILFMGLFAAITPALIVGGFAERMKFSAVMLFTVIWFTINYIPMAHMGWGGGWVFEWGPQDFAGGNVVHINIGVAALVAAWMVGPRLEPTMAPHNMTMNMTGASLLWVGWLGFCGGCALVANGYSMLVVFNTMLGSAGGATAWMLIEWLHRGKPSMLGIASGAITGLVAITPACGFVGPVGAILVGVLSTPVCILAVEKLKPMLGQDDALDVFGIHGIGGIIGGLLTTVFALSVFAGQGLPEGRGLGAQMLVQIGAIVFSIIFSAITSYIALKIASIACGGLRVSDEQQEIGLDPSEHGEVGYKLSA
ncbi:ammonia channel protein [Lampropedia cohaerens]|uniref:Ammonium transporter n=1 Tax=Lampropedia cohaerens TaxID=1610491 RepID=A0A0U1Q0B7_9BURK|nr:ammonium transporter [Lampropedia cohaerens]KKW68045.1 ammonia channel protein [Lampropedia cohaerens]